MNAIIYARFSPRPNAEECMSIDVQVDRCRTYCALREMPIVAIVRDEAISGAGRLEQRDGGAELLAQIKKHGAGAVIAMRLDRLFRNAVDCLSTVDRWTRKKIALHVVDLGGNAIDTTSAAGRFMLTVLAAAAEMERNMIRERTSSAMRFRQANGELMSNPDSCPYGMKAEGRRLVPCETEQENIVTVVRLHGSGLGLRAIARAMNKSGAKPRQREWYHGTIRTILKRSAEQEAAKTPASAPAP